MPDHNLKLHLPGLKDAQLLDHGQHLQHHKALVGQLQIISPHYSAPPRQPDPPSPPNDPPLPWLRSPHWRVAYNAPGIVRSPPGQSPSTSGYERPEGG
jgi:hypothetical protein